MSESDGDCSQVLNLYVKSNGNEWKSNYIEVDHECRKYLQNDPTIIQAVEQCFSDINDSMQYYPKCLFYTHRLQCAKFERLLFGWSLSHDPIYCKFVDEMLQMWLMQQYSWSLKMIRSRLANVWDQRFHSPKEYEANIIYILMEMYCLWHLSDFKELNECMSRLDDQICWVNWQDNEMLSIMVTLVKWNEDSVSKMLDVRHSRIPYAFQAKDQNNPKDEVS